MATVDDGARRREVITLCIEGDYSAFDEESERKLRKALAGMLDAEIAPELIKFEKPPLSASRAARIGTKRCRLKVEVDEGGYAHYSSDARTSDDESSEAGSSRRPKASSRD